MNEGHDAAPGAPVALHAVIDPHDPLSCAGTEPDRLQGRPWAFNPRPDEPVRAVMR